MDKKRNVRTKGKIFISYCHKDEKWKDMLVSQLGVLQKQGLMELWDDRKIHAGDEWYDEIMNALNSSSIAVLMISADFLNSEFILNEEVPKILAQRTRRGLRVVPIILRPCTWTKVKWLSVLQARPKDGRPIAGGNEYQQESDMALIAEEILNFNEAVMAGGKSNCVSLLPSKVYLDGLSNSSGSLIGDIKELAFLDEYCQNPKVKDVSSEKMPFNNIPYARNPNFSGREMSLMKIRKSFNSGNYKAFTQAITGLGGVGKTQIALEYSFRYGHEYDLIWWVRSENTIDLLKDYKQFAVKKGLIEETINETDIIIEVMQNWMNNSNNWLFIYDNAEEYKVLSHYLPKKNNGHILITSRSKNWKNVGEILHIDIFNIKEAEEFLLKRTDLNDKKGMIELAGELGYLPLALEQAAAYIYSAGKSFSEYLNLYNKYKLSAMKEYQPVGYHYTVATTWQISIDKISNECVKQLLNICAFMEPDNIHELIFIDGEKNLPHPLSNAVSNEIEFDNMISELTKYSLVNVNRRIMKLHRLLQVVLRSSLDVYTWLKYTVDLIHCILVFDYNKIETWAKCSRILPHALSIIKYADEYGIYCEKTVEIMNKTAQYLNLIMARYEEAESLLRKALEVSENLLVVKQPYIATTLNNLAGLFYNQSKYTESELFYKRSLEIRESVLGSSHPDTILTFNNLAGLYINQGRNNEAEELIMTKKIFDISDNWLSAEHPYTASSLNNIAGLYYNKGRYVEAMTLYQRVLEIRENVLGGNHPYTATSLNNLARLYCHQKRYEKAELLYKRALEIRETILGINHPYTATSLNNLAGLYYNKGEHELAESLLKKALEISENVLGANHIYTATCLNNLAGLYKNQGRYDKAEPLFIRAVEIREKQYVVNNTAMVKSLNFQDIAF